MERGAIHDQQIRALSGLEEADSFSRSSASWRVT